MLAAWAFWITITLTVCHEIDAVRRHEWRILPVTSFLPDVVGQRVFLASHLPLAALLVWIASLGPNSTAGFWLSLFMVIHVGLHWIYRNHPKNEFNNNTSWLLIAGAGIAGFLHILATI